MNMKKIKKNHHKNGKKSKKKCKKKKTKWKNEKMKGKKNGKKWWKKIDNMKKIEKMEKNEKMKKKTKKWKIWKMMNMKKNQQITTKMSKKQNEKMNKNEKIGGGLGLGEGLPPHTSQTRNLFGRGEKVTPLLLPNLWPVWGLPPSPSLLLPLSPGRVLFFFSFFVIVQKKNVSAASSLWQTSNTVWNNGRMSPCFCGWNLERKHCCRRHWRIEGDGRFWTLDRSLDAKEVSTSERSGNFFFCGRWNRRNICGVQFQPGRRPNEEKNKKFFKEQSNESHS